MRQCVGTYLPNIEKGKCSVWSMKARRSDLVRRATTIQPDLGSRRIVRCQGPCNRQPEAEERRSSSGGPRRMGWGSAASDQPVMASHLYSVH
jgi:hypothetical protein